MRRHAPTLVDPTDVVRGATDRQLGIGGERSLEQRVATLERLLAGLSRPAAPAGLLSPEAILGALPMQAATVLRMQAPKGSITADTVTSTTGTTIVNGNLGPLAAGVPYLVIGQVAMNANAPSGQSIISLLRIEATGVNTEGMRTATVSGERTLVAFDGKLIVGTGASVNVAGRARVTGGSGTVNNALVWALAIPLAIPQIG